MRQPLRHLIRECRGRHATDPRGKIFALLGLMGDLMNNYLKPGYIKPANEVYANVTLHFISESKSLDPTWGQQVPGHQDDLLSSVPDYSLNEDLIASPLVPLDWHESLYSASEYDSRSQFLIPANFKLLALWAKLRTED